MRVSCMWRFGYNLRERERVHSFLLPLWSLGIELKSPGLAAGAAINWASSLTLLSFKVKETSVFVLLVKCLHCTNPKSKHITSFSGPWFVTVRTISYPFTVCSVRGSWCDAGSCRLGFQCGYSKLREQGMKSQTISFLPFLLLMWFYQRPYFFCMYLLLDMAAGPLTSTRGHCCFLCCPP